MCLPTRANAWVVGNRAGHMQREGSHMTKRRKREHARRRVISGTGAGPRRRTHKALPRRRPRSESKLRACLDLLERREGATVEDLQSITGWLPHSVRGFLSGTVKKKLKLDVASLKEERGRVYRVTSAGGAG